MGPSGTRCHLHILCLTKSSLNDSSPCSEASYSMANSSLTTSAALYKIMCSLYILRLVRVCSTASTTQYVVLTALAVCCRRGVCSRGSTRCRLTGGRAPPTCCAVPSALPLAPSTSPSSSLHAGWITCRRRPSWKDPPPHFKNTFQVCLQP